MSTDKKELLRGLKYELIALPLLFLAPVLITIGYKAINKDQNYLWLIAGILIATVAVILAYLGIRIVLNALFNNKK